MAELSWNIPLKNYVNIDKYSRMELDHLNKGVLILCELTENSPEHYESLPLDQLTKEVSEAYNFISKKPELPLKKYFTFAGRRYKFALDLEEITYGDFEAISTLKITEQTLAENLHYILAQIAKPADKWWRFKSEETFTKRAEQFKDIPCLIGLPIALFFWNLATELSPVIVNKSNKIIQKLKDDLTSTKNH